MSCAVAECWSLITRSIIHKKPEFNAWLLEERKINPETISRDLERKEFARFVEDYNTGAPKPLTSSFYVHHSPSDAPPRKVLQHGGV